MKRSSILILSLFMTLAMFVVPSAETEVGGIIDTDTTWTTEDSPYVVTETIQIPKGVELTIEPDVTVTGKNNIDEMFKVNGNILAHGTSDSRIAFKEANTFFKAVRETNSQSFVSL